MFDYYIRCGQKELRCGYTTGTCSALAAQGAARLLLTGERAELLSISTPKGWSVEAVPEGWRQERDSCACAVRKDSGDDPDVTDGMIIWAEVQAIPEPGIRIDGGEGVGRVTKNGLDQPMGSAAINRVPREMISQSVQAVCEETGYEGGLLVTISLPEGRRLAEKTFNPHLGIVGGLSILGTSGIVEPMSQQAIIDTIAVELNQICAEGHRDLVLIPGNYGLDFLAQGGLSLPKQIPHVRFSNFLGDSLDLCPGRFDRVLVVGHIGKLVKLAGGIMNTHSKYADCRTELFCAYAAVSGGGQELCEKLLHEGTTEGCLDLLEQAGLREQVMDRLMAAMQTHLSRRAGESIRIGAATFSSRYGLLGITAQGKEILAEWKGRKIE